MPTVPDEPRSAAQPASRSRLRTVVLLLGVLLLCGAGLEAGLRVALGTPPAWRFPQERYVPDDLLGYALAPGQRAFTIDQPVATSSLGLRDDEVAAGREARLRILAVGDSQTFGVGIAVADTWPEQLARILSERLAPCRVDALNGGLPAASTWREALLARRLLPLYRPHVVVVGFYVNDVYAESATPPFPVGTGREHSARRRVELALKRSATVLAVRNAVYTLRTLGRPAGERDYESAVIADAPHPRKEAGWAQVRSSLTAIRDDAARHGATVVLLAMPRIDQVDGRNPARGVQRRLATIARELGLEIVDPLPALREAAARGVALTVPWDGHYAAPGQREMARALAPVVAAAPGARRCPQPPGDESSAAAFR